jgi:hypothetical protein
VSPDRRIVTLEVVALAIGVAVAAESAQVTDEASAIAAAKRYTKARCTKEAPSS